jgi:hypothetical protein
MLSRCKQDSNLARWDFVSPLLPYLATFSYQNLDPGSPGLDPLPAVIIIIRCIIFLIFRDPEEMLLLDTHADAGAVGEASIAGFLERNV